MYILIYIYIYTVWDLLRLEADPSFWVTIPNFVLAAQLTTIKLYNNYIHFVGEPWNGVSRRGGVYLFFCIQAQPIKPSGCFLKWWYPQNTPK